MDTEATQTNSPVEESISTPNGESESIEPTSPVEAADDSQVVKTSMPEATSEKEDDAGDGGAKGESDRVVPQSSAPTFQLPDGPRVDVSAATVARMMGIASTSDLRVLEGRIDLLTSKVSAILTKVDRSLSMFSSIPTASDIGRLEVQVAAIKAMMKELLDSVGAPAGAEKDRSDRELAQEQSRKLRQGIKTNTDSQ